MIKIWVLALSWQLNALARLRRQLEALLDGGLGETLPAEEAQLLRGMLLIFRGQEEYHHNRLESAIACCREALAILPHSWSCMRGTAVTYLDEPASQWSGEVAVSQFREEYQALSDKGDAYARLFSVCVLFISMQAI
jgi:hypothetical protein